MDPMVDYCDVTLLAFVGLTGNVCFSQHLINGAKSVFMKGA